jgi:hypothetical protein
LSYQSDGQISEGGQRLRLVSRAGAATVFKESHVAHVMQRVFNAPVLAGYLQKFFRRGRIGGETGYAVRRLLAGVTPPGDAENLRYIRPLVQIAAQ